MTRRQNRRNFLIAFALSCGNAAVVVATAVDKTWIADASGSVKVLVLGTMFLTMSGVCVLLGPLGIFPHVKKMFPKGSRYWKSLWFVPDLEG